VRSRRFPKCSYSSSSPRIGLARHNGRLGREVLRVLEHAQPRRQVDEPPDEREDVLGGEDAHVLRYRDAEPLVELVAADLRQVVALRVEEQRAQQVARVVERRRLARGAAS
jgi:hypothetical protein